MSWLTERNMVKELELAKTKRVREEITIERCVDLKYLDPIFTDPELRGPTLDDSMPKELPNTVASAMEVGCIFLKPMVNGKGVGFFMLVPDRELGERCLEVHTCLTADCRGFLAMLVGRAGIEWVWAHTNARRMTSVCPDWLPQTRVFARGCGFKRDFHVENCYQRGGREYGCWHVEIFRPVLLTDEELGERFHRQLEELRPDALPEQHGDDTEHDRRVGRAIRVGVLEGDPMTAMDEYNTWAWGAGYVSVLFVGWTKQGLLVVDILEAEIGLSADGSVVQVGGVFDVVEGGPTCPQQQQLSVPPRRSAESPIPRVKPRTNPILLTTDK